MLEIRDIALTFGSRQILCGVSLSAKAGETVGLIGPNGSGKTSLFNCICGFVTPQSGRVILGGRDISTLDPFRRAQAGLGRVFQNSGIFREQTVLDNMLIALELRDQARWISLPWSGGHKKRIDEAYEQLRKIGLDSHAAALAGTLSGGQLRLLEIQRSLARGAEVFLLDEPTAGVSPKMKDAVADIIRTLHRMNKATIIIEHDLRFIEGFCNRIVALDGGRVVIDDTPAAVRESPRLQEIYFGGAPG